ncbi:MAG: hypothetical protein SH850_17615 [Planctomycetaceae bacterium]|nr:hypothetical protein [Planctomycetaceae bacterium]
MRTAILKVGGSLFDLRDLGPRLQRVLSHIDAERKVLFPGGGEAADIVRHWHQEHGLSDEQSHWLAIHATGMNANLLSVIVPCRILSRREALEIKGLNDSEIWAMAPWHFIFNADQAYSDAPPHVWDVTSDTLAAWTAIRWPAEELLLLKSVPCPVGRTATEAVQAGLVDPYFPGYAGRLPRVSWCCLRDDEPTVVPWLEHGICVSR